MLRFFILVAFVSVGCAYVLPPRIFPAPTVPSAGRIVGGEETTIEDVPYQVVMLFLDIFWCGGTIVKPNAIVTAAHCTFIMPASMFTFRAGSSYRKTGGQVVSAKRLFNHERYPIGLLDYDIAVVQLSSDIFFGASAAPITLAPQGLEVPAGSIAQVSGWGQTSFEGSTSEVIRKVVIPIVDQDLCKQAYGRSLTRRMICAGLFEEGGKDACQGDSGGPLVVDNILVGVTSWGNGCAEPGYPGVYARVPEFRNWLDKKLSQIP